MKIKYDLFVTHIQNNFFYAITSIYDKQKAGIFIGKYYEKALKSIIDDYNMLHDVGISHEDIIFSLNKMYIKPMLSNMYAYMKGNQFVANLTEVNNINDVLKLYNINATTSQKTKSQDIKDKKKDLEKERQKLNDLKKRNRVYSIFGIIWIILCVLFIIIAIDDPIYFVFAVIFGIVGFIFMINCLSIKQSINTKIEKIDEQISQLDEQKWTNKNPN